MASDPQPSHAKRKRKRSPSLSSSPPPSQGGLENDDDDSNTSKGSAGSSSDDEDALEICRRRVPHNERTRILISQLELFELIGYGLREKEMEKKEKEKDREQFNAFTPGSMLSDTSTLKNTTSTPQNNEDKLDLQLTLDEPDKFSSPDIDLNKTKIFIHAQPPADVWAKISCIIDRTVPSDERANLRKVAVRFHKRCVSVIRNNSEKGEVEVENEVVEPFQVAFSSVMPVAVKYTNHDNITEAFGAKVNTKDPEKAYAGRDANFNKVTSSRLSKKCKTSADRTALGLPNTTDGTSTAPNPSMAPSVASDEAAKPYQIKIPLADLTAATALTSFVTKFSDPRWSVISACISFNSPVNLSPSASNPLRIVLTPSGAGLFGIERPFAFVEDKACVGAKQLREAEDRTAMTAAVALLGLTKGEETLQKNKSRHSRPEDTLLASPLFFSFTIQGPVHELRVHWSTVEQGEYHCHSKLVDSYNAQLLHRAEELVIRMKNIAL